MDIHKEAYKELDKIRTTNQKLKENRTQEIYKNVPKIKLIDQKISDLGIQITTSVLQNPKDIDIVMQNLKKQINTLKQEKSKLLSEKYPPNYLDLHHFCNICKDIGHVASKRCSCVDKHITDKYLELSGIKDILERENFEKFDLSYYSDNQIPGTDLTEKKYMQAIVNQVKFFCKNFGIQNQNKQNYDNILFFGEPGRGKTFLCNCIAKELTNRGFGVFYSTSTRLSKTIESSKFEKDEQAKKMLDLYYTSPLIILDDLGTEFSTTITDPELFSIINHRITAQKPTIISTNLDSKSIEAMYSQRIASRLFGEYKPYKIIGSDIRLAKRLKNI